MWNKDWVINVKTTQCDMTPEIRAYLDDKINAISKLVVVSGEDAKVTCDVELEKAQPQQTGPIWRAEMNLTFDGNMYRSEATAESINAALDEVKDEMTKRLRRDKKKRFDRLRRGGAKMKDWMRFGRKK
ncbi:ribosomal subunit interface protein [Candidatus Kaiserbacteria bacterium CG10_big_fil_rev_8_21_14_0_10_43_70]|uniref:Ribosomal subunit interface protein n=1 Tax=Candidatus Kaiserbacteria bacterium CG10_big_fil_rev_8_21_14_0_10_43_70 TaxID=1974605 RepID=A0A2H0UIR5_9BACT|nr:MAG: ribosomal subunit interface protein [Candidatus Kaiserbacteria bacterium CG10_big_fil_rev_8_21_14_0_10_43_70]